MKREVEIEEVLSSDSEVEVEKKKPTSILKPIVEQLEKDSIILPKTKPGQKRTFAISKALSPSEHSKDPSDSEEIELIILPKEPDSTKKLEPPSKKQATKPVRVNNGNALKCDCSNGPNGFW